MQSIVIVIGLTSLFAIIIFPSSTLANVILWIASFLFPLGLIAYGYYTQSIPVCILGTLIFCAQIYLYFEKQIKAFFIKEK